MFTETFEGARQPVPNSHEQLTVSTTAVSLASIPNTAQMAIIFVGGTADQAVRYTLDGTTPTATLGLHKLVGTQIVLVGRDTIQRFQAIREDGADITLDISYFQASKQTDAA